MSTTVRVWISFVLVLIGAYAVFGMWKAYVVMKNELEPRTAYAGASAPVDGQLVPPGARIQHGDEPKLVDTRGETFDLKSLDGQVWCVSFFFSSCPGPCAEMNRAIAQLQKDMPDSPVKFVSITVDPANDTPERLAKYAHSFNADPERWKFLTGPFEYVQRIGQQDLKQHVSPGEHAKDVMIVDRDGKVVGRYDATVPANMLSLRRRLEKMAAGDKRQPDAKDQPAEEAASGQAQAPDNEPSEPAPATSEATE